MNRKEQNEDADFQLNYEIVGLCSKVYSSVFTGDDELVEMYIGQLKNFIGNDAVEGYKKSITEY